MYSFDGLLGILWMNSPLDAYSRTTLTLSIHKATTTIPPILRFFHQATELTSIHKSKPSSAQQLHPSNNSPNLFEFNEWIFIYNPSSSFPWAPITITNTLLRTTAHLALCHTWTCCRKTAIWMSYSVWEWVRCGHLWSETSAYFIQPSIWLLYKIGDIERRWAGWVSYSA